MILFRKEIILFGDSVQGLLNDDLKSIFGYTIVHLVLYCSIDICTHHVHVKCASCIHVGCELIFGACDMCKSQPFSIELAINLPTSEWFSQHVHYVHQHWVLLQKCCRCIICQFFCKMMHVINITKLLGCVMWDRVSIKHNSPLNPGFHVHGKHSCCVL